MQVKVIGAGLAGCEAAWQLANRNIDVLLYEMKPKKMTPAHHSPDFAELVCSNSLRGDRLENGVGLLQEELRRLDSLILTCAEATREVPSELDLVPDLGSLENLRVSIGNDELNAFNFVGHHVINGVLTAAAYTDNLDVKLEITIAGGSG